MLNRKLIGLVPKFARVNSKGRDEGKCLHIVGREGTVEIVADSHFGLLLKGYGFLHTQIFCLFHRVSSNYTFLLLYHYFTKNAIDLAKNVTVFLQFVHFYVLLEAFLPLFHLYAYKTQKVLAAITKTKKRRKS
jgi:hypothetical protein